MNKKSTRFAPIGLVLSGAAFLVIVGVLIIRAFEASGLYTPPDPWLLERIMYIAIAVFVENGYWGSRFAGRMASLMIEKYIKGTITRTDLENWILTHSLENEYAKPYSGEPFKINGETTLQLVDKVQSNQDSDLDSSVRIDPASNLN